MEPLVHSIYGMSLHTAIDDPLAPDLHQPPWYSRISSQIHPLGPPHAECQSVDVAEYHTHDPNYSQYQDTSPLPSAFSNETFATLSSSLID